MKGLLSKSIALMMAIVMLLVFLPAAGVQAIAEEIGELKQETEIQVGSLLQETAEYYDELAESNTTKEYEIIEEVVEKRAENQKEFLLSDGSFLMAVYGNAVHYEEGGEWVDIDNTLVFEAAEKTADPSAEDLMTDESFEDAEDKISEDEFELEADAEDEESVSDSSADMSSSSENTAPEESKTKEITSPEEFSGYKNTANPFEVKFASDLSQGVLYNVRDGGYSITMSLMKQPDSKGIASLASDDASSRPDSEKASAELEKVAAGLGYKEVYDNVDIKYVLDGASIKEDIIVKSPSAPSSYAFRFVVDGLKVEQIDGEYISFTDKETGEEIYTIPRPFTYDRYGQILFNSWQVLEDKGDGVYELTIAIGEEYMDEEVCAFPITIDPILVKSASSFTGDLTYKVGGGTEGYPSQNWGGPGVQSMCAGNLAMANVDPKRVRSYFQWGMPTIEDGATIVNATLNLRVAFTHNYDPSSSYKLTVNAYMMDRTWSGSAMNWNTQPLPHRTNNDFIEEIITPLDSRSYTCTANGASNLEISTKFDVTRAVQSWYQGTAPNYGIAFGSDQESGYSNGHMSYVVYWSPNVSMENASRHPYFVLNYRTAVGTESYWDTYSHSAAASTAGNVNLHNGSLSLTTSIFNDRVLRMPFSYSYTYNSIKTNSTYGGAPYAGQGWVSNISQKITKVTASAYTSLGYKYIYMDADGTEHWFYTYNNKIVDEDGLNLTITDSKATYYILETKNKDKLYFRKTDGLLSHYEGFNDENKTQLSYTSGPAIRITAPGNRVSEVYKSGTGNYISSFVDPMGYTSYMTVTSNKLTGITLGASKSSAVLSYDYHPSNGLLTRVSDSFGNKTEYTYNSRKQVIELEQFVYDEVAEQYQLVNHVKFDYTTTNQTIVRSWGADETIDTADDILTTYIFDGFGATINVHTTSADKKTMYSAASYQYTDRKSDNANANPEQSNRIEMASYTTGSNENLIANGNFEKMNGSSTTDVVGDMSGWSPAVWDAGDYSATLSDFDVSLDNTVSYIGDYSLKFETINAVSTRAKLAAEYTVTLEPGVYMFSAYVKYDISPTSWASGALLYEKNGNLYNGVSNIGTSELQINDISLAEYSGSDEKMIDGWVRRGGTLYVTGDNPQTVQIGLMFHNQNGVNNLHGTIWIDGVKLERIGNDRFIRNSTEIYTWSEYNHITNNSFETNNASHIPTGWTVVGTGTQSVQGNFIGSTPVSALFGSYGVRMGMTHRYTTSAVSQVIPISGKKGDVFVFGGWSKGMPNASGGDYGIKATVYYYNGASTKTSSTTAHFNKYYTDWQYTSAPIVIEDMGAGYVPRSIKIELLYKNMASYAVFDNIHLIRDTGYSYTYDSKGNLVSTTDYNDRKVGIVYDQVTNLPEKYIDVQGNEYLYEYDADRNLTGTTTPLGILTSTEYNEFGQGISGAIVPIGGDLTGENSIHSYSEYSVDGNFLVGTTNSRGYSSNTVYDTSTGLVESVTNPAGQTTYYDYSANGLLNETTALVNGTTLSVEMEYNDRNQLTSYSNGNTDYSINYTSLGQYESFIIGESDPNERVMISNQYPYRGSYLQRVTYGNGYREDYQYDSLGRLFSVGTTAGFSIRYTYDNEGRLLKSNTVGGDSETNSYIYSLDGTQTKWIRRSTYSPLSVTKVYDNRGNIGIMSIDPSHESGTANTINLYYTYNEDSQPLSTIIKSGLGGSSHNEYDDLGRLDAMQYVFNNTEIEIDYSYARGASKDSNDMIVQDNGETMLVDGAEYYLNGAATPFDGFHYEYDILGNITEIHRYDTTQQDYDLIASYEYDDLSQLIRENDVDNNRTVIYEYDNFGNITSEKIYDYTLAATPSGAFTENTWTYDDSGWGDLLTEYNGNEFTHDGIGNPLEYHNGWVMTWERGRQLATVNRNGNSTIYRYDLAGQRTNKTYLSGTFSNYSAFIYVDGKLMSENQSYNGQTYMLRYYYDATDSLYAFDYSTNYGNTYYRYYYLRSPNGNIVSIMNASGQVVVEYAYDAWGNIISVSGTMGNTLGQVNPFRYKGYYYDRETGFYYLQSRYYDPVTHRFLNADGYANTAQGFGGENMFAYSLNSPINRVDPSGKVSYSIMIGYTNRGSGKTNSNAIAKTALSKKMAETGMLINAGNAFKATYLDAIGRFDYHLPAQPPNCYGFALGRTEVMQPGIYSGIEISQNPYDLEATYAAVEADLKTLGLTARRLNGPTDLISSNEYRVALRVGSQNLHNKDNGDYHFLSKQTQ